VDELGGYSAPGEVTRVKCVTYTPELAAKFCAAIADGGSGSVRPMVCAKAGMPSKATVFRWLRDHADFAKLYEQATDDRADAHIDEIIEIADKLQGRQGRNPKAKLRIYARIEAVQRMKPKKYGSKMQLTGDGGGAIEFTGITAPHRQSHMSELIIETPAVFEPLLSPARYKGAHGGRGSGKSHFFAEMLIEDCIREPISAVCLREVQKSLKFSVKRLLEQKIQAMNAGLYFEVQNEQIKTRNGGVIIFQGMQDHTADSIKSLEGFKRAWVEEAQSAQPAQPGPAAADDPRAQLRNLVQLEPALRHGPGRRSCCAARRCRLAPSWSRRTTATTPGARRSCWTRWRSTARAIRRSTRTSGSASTR
jgi:hypothetical protein